MRAAFRIMLHFRPHAGNNVLTTVGDTMFDGVLSDWFDQSE